MTHRSGRPTDPAEDPLFRPVDLLALAFVGALLGLAALAWARDIAGAQAAIGRLGAAAALIVGLRSARALRFLRLGELLGAIAPVGLVPVDWALDPITDLVSPALRDPALLRMDRLLFGETPSLTLQGLLSPALTEVLLVCYLSFFTLLVLPTLLFWLRRDRASLESYVQVIVLFFVTNLGLYLVVPAVGPRFLLERDYAQPLHGLLFGDSIRDMFLHTPYFRDCFPSGHTAGTLVALAFTSRRLRGYFVAALPIGLLCISATILCRFHYAVDVLCGLPLAAWALGAARYLDPAAWAAFSAGVRGQLAPGLAPRPRAAASFREGQLEAVQEPGGALALGEAAH
ncbi:MAG: hypothetical protein NVS2B9_16400 [Myxococcales bacterium]